MTKPTIPGADVSRAFLAAPVHASGPIRDLPIKALVESPTNPRKGALKALDLDGLAASIARVGILSPVVVREHPEGGAKFEIVFGHRRVAAAVKAGLAKVPCEIRKLSDVQVVEAQIVENVQRQDVTALEEADGYSTLLDTAGYTVDQLAARVGKSKGWIYSRLKLRSLGKDGRRELLAGRLPPSVAVPLARLDEKLQKSALAHFYARDTEEIEESWTARAMISWLQERYAQNLKGCPFDLDDATLVEKAGPCSTCSKRSGAKRAQAGLFADFEKGADVCTDTRCYASKVAAEWERVTAPAVEKGAKRLKIADGEKAWRNGRVAAGSRWVEVTEKIEGAKGQGYGDARDKLPEDKRPAVYLLPDERLRPHKVVDRAELEKACAEAGQPWAKVAEAEAVAPSPTAAAAAKVERVTVERVGLELARVLGETLDKADPIPLDALRLAASGVQTLKGFDAVAARRDLPENFAEVTERADLLRIIVETLIFELIDPGWVPLVSPEVRDAARIARYDLAAAIAATRTTVEAEQKTEGE